LIIGGGLVINSSRIEKLLRGAIDFHVHADPDPFHERRIDIFALALQGKAIGMKAIVVKCHHFSTAPLATLVNRMVSGITLIGSVTLNSGVGGLNPEVVEVSARAGARVVWMPTYSSTIDTEKRKEKSLNTKPAISLIDEENRLLPETISVLDIIKENDMVIGTGHISAQEIFELTKKAREMGIKITITHPLTSGFGNRLNMEQQKELVSMGAYIEHCFVACMPVLGGLDPKIMVEHIKAVGPKNCILSTDFGQGIHPLPSEGFRMMVGYMLQYGLSEDELDVMIKENPSRILGIG